MKQYLRFGIVGAGGYWGPNWVRVLKQLGVLAAICEVSPERQRKLIDRFSLDDNEVQVFDDYSKMLDMQLDGVFIVTAPATHAALAVQAMEAGSHVFIEKPLAHTVDDAFRIKYKGEHLGRKVMVGHTFVYHPAIRAFKQHLGVVGELRTLYTVRANFGQYQTAGIVRDLLPHDLSIFNYALDRVFTSVTAQVNPHQDTAFVTVCYPGVVCNAFLSWGYPDKTRKLVAVGDRAILEWDLSLSHLLLHAKYAERTEQGSFSHVDDGTKKIQIFDQSEALLNEAIHFVECIEKDTNPLTDADAGIAVVKGVEACL